MQEKVQLNNLDKTIKTYIDRIIYSSPQAIISFCEEYQLTIPRSLRVEAYKKALKESFEEELTELLEQEKQYPETISLRESKRIIRLRNRYDLGEYLLDKEYQMVHSYRTDKKYYETLWLAFITHAKQNGVPVDILEKWLLETAQAVTLEELPNQVLFNQELDAMIIDKEGTLEGVEVSRLKKVYLQTANKQEIREMGKKYDIVLPTSYNKKEVLKIFFEQLENAGKMNQEIKEKALSSTILELKELALYLGEELQTYLTKEGMIQYVIEHVHPQRLPIEASDDSKESIVSHEKDDDEIVKLKKEVAELREIVDGMRNGQSHVTVPSKRYSGYSKIQVIDVLALVVLVYLAVGLVSYFFSDVSLFATINNLVNLITYRNQGLMEHYHSIIRSIIQ